MEQIQNITTARLFTNLRGKAFIDFSFEFYKIGGIYFCVLVDLYAISEY